jgi:hypothetical protein
MNWLSLVTELEALIFWLASLILLAPKTLYCIIRRPKKMITVLSQEIDNPRARICNPCPQSKFK